MQLQVGKTYIDHCGAKVRIHAVTDDTNPHFIGVVLPDEDCLMPKAALYGPDGCARGPHPSLLREKRAPQAGDIRRALLGPKDDYLVLVGPTGSPEGGSGARWSAVNTATGLVGAYVLSNDDPIPDEEAPARVRAMADAIRAFDRFRLATESEVTGAEAASNVWRIEGYPILRK